ncbi:MAG: phosphonate metabolism protein/1,5-bisphosphokinase (PRPP-forming) PhnN [Proteobacteria bacterium]|nr:phosphonate metabolism protein/1,5-bisphosphokinase (PRPP-forming) PhnN [Pseudomonadota bacterium]
MARPDDSARGPIRGTVPSGTLVLVVGPSGAGKDSLIDAARRCFERESRICFPRRWITRREDAGGERHIAVPDVDFDRLQARGAFALSRRAHGFGYGIPAEIVADLEAGCAVVANVSRGVIGGARRRFPNLAICLVTASNGVLARRMALRGRESANESEGRMARAAAVPVEGGDVIKIVNDGALDDAVEQFIGLLQGLLR